MRWKRREVRGRKGGRREIGRKERKEREGGGSDEGEEGGMNG